MSGWFVVCYISETLPSSLVALICLSDHAQHEAAEALIRTRRHCYPGRTAFAPGEGAGSMMTYTLHLWLVSVQQTIWLHWIDGHYQEGF